MIGAMQREDTLRRSLLSFWNDGTVKTPGTIIGWIRRFKYIPSHERRELFRKSIENLPEDVRQYLREWRWKILGGYR